MWATCVKCFGIFPTSQFTPLLPVLPTGDDACGLRDYGTGLWEGGKPDCDHTNHVVYDKKNDTSAGAIRGGPMRDVCTKCGARRVDRQLGLEPTPELYVENMVGVFREVRRVLRRDGTLWLNIGDSYAASGGDDRKGSSDGSVGRGDRPDERRRAGLKPKDLVGVPWRLAFALQQDGWCLRSEIVWSKPNPMPESVTDRPTKAHEQLFLLTKCDWKGGDIEPWPMSREQAIWLAALVDGEGSICFQERANATMAPNIGPRLSVVNTNRELLERITEITNVDGNETPSPRTRSNGEQGRPVFAWQVTNAKAARIIAAIRPHLIAKTRQAELALYVHKLNQKHKGRGDRTTAADLAEKRRAAEACSTLNRGGEVDLWFEPIRTGRWVPNAYHYDADAVREPHKWEHVGETRLGDRSKNGGAPGAPVEGKGNTTGSFRAFAEGGRNLRSVWEIPTQPFSEAHFATFPQALVERCVKAGTSERGCCPVCGAAWERVVESAGQPPEPEHRQPPKRLEPGQAGNVGAGNMGFRATRLSGQEIARWKAENPDRELGWRPTCDHDHQPVPCVVLDPFMGSGTTALVSRRLGRRSIGIELNQGYATMAARRLSQLSLLAEGAS